MEGITYSIQAWEDKKALATYSKFGFKTKDSATRAFNRLKKKGIYKAINMRKEETLSNGWEISTPIVMYDVKE